MVLCTLLALMTGAAVLAVLLPLSRLPAGAEPTADVPFYASQLREIDRDRERGLLGDEEATAARIESGRRLLRASEASPEQINTTSEPALRRRRAAAALALCLVPIVGLAAYGDLGSPHLPDQPSTARAAASPPVAPTLADALGQIEAHLARNPDDVRAWDIVAPVYVRAGRFTDAARAFGQARRLGGDTVARLLGEGEARVTDARGTVGPEARALFQRATELDSASPPARYYLALAAEQDGDQAAAREAYGKLLADSPPDAPWRPLVGSRLAQLGGGTGESAASPAGIPDAVAPEIAAMVSGLDERLKAGGGTEAEWSRLIRSYVVLGQRDEAADRLRKGKLALAGSAEGQARLNQLAAELGLVPGLARR